MEKMEKNEVKNELIELSEKKNIKERPGFLHTFFLVFLLSAVFGSFFGITAGIFSQNVKEKMNNFLGVQKNYPSDKQEIIKEKVIEEDSVITVMVEKSSPAVVSIVITKDVPIFRRSVDHFNFFDPFGDFFGNQDMAVGTEKQKVGGGTGFLISKDGMVLTNKHVVFDQNVDYTVVASDGKEYSAKVLARDPIKDLAVIKIEGADFPILNLGDSDQLKTGQTVVAIGNSLAEFSNTVSKGIVSGLKRSLMAGSGNGRSEKLNDIIQTDAAINPGNSGGPLLNINGEVIGINVAVAQGAENIGFAIPINQAKRMIDQVEKTGKISTPFLGVRYLPIDETVKNENNLDFDYGVIVSRGEKMTDFAVIPGSPADKAGIVENDIILEIGGKKIDKKSSLSDLIAEYNVGEEITLKVWSKGVMKETSVKLEERK